MPQASLLTGSPPPAPPVPSRAELEQMATDEAVRQGVDPTLVTHLIGRGENPTWDVHAVSPMGAQGLMQLMPSTASSLGVKNVFDPIENIRAGVTYLKKQLDTHKGKPNQRALALASYNAGPAVVERFKGMPPYKETQGYVQRILGGGEGIGTAQPQEERIDPSQIDAQEERIDPSQIENGFDASVGQAAQGATRLTPGYSPTVEFLRTLPAAIGSMAGAAVRKAGPWGTALGGLVGGVGAAAGELGTAGLEQHAYNVGLSAVPPPTWEGLQSRVGEAAAAGATGELLGRGVTAVGSKVAAPFKGSVDTAGLEVRNMFPNALPNQVATSHTLDTLTHVAEHAPFTGSGIAERRAMLANQAQQEALGIAHHYGGPITPEAAGTRFTDALEANTGAFKAHAGQLYADVDNAAKGVKVDMGSLKEFAAAQLERRAGVPGEVSGNRGLKMLQQVAKAGETDEAGSAQAQEMAAALGVEPKQFLADPAYAKIRSQIGITDQPMAKEMSFQQAQTFRSDLLSFIRRAKSEKDDVAKGVAQQLVSKLDTAMDTAASGAPGAREAYRTANAFYKTGKQKYESELMRGLADAYPEKIADQLVTPRATTPIREARAAVGEKGWRGIQASVAHRLIEGSTSLDGTTIDGAQLLGKLRELSPPTIHEVFPGEHARDLWTLARVLDRSQRTASWKGRMGIYLGQAGLVTTAIHHGTLPTELGAGVIMLGPAMLSRLLASPLGAKWLSIGLLQQPGTRLAARAAARIGAALGAQQAVDRESPPAPDAHAGPPPPP